VGRHRTLVADEVVRLAQFRRSQGTEAEVEIDPGTGGLTAGEVGRVATRSMGPFSPLDSADGLLHRTYGAIDRVIDASRWS